MRRGPADSAPPCAQAGGSQRRGTFDTLRGWNSSVVVSSCSTSSIPDRQDGPVVVLLHGFPEQHTMWQSIIPRLTEHGYRCLAPRQRGYSPGARPTRRRDYVVSELAEDSEH